MWCQFCVLCIQFCILRVFVLLDGNALSQANQLTNFCYQLLQKVGEIEL